MNLRVITKEREILNVETDAVTLPGECGRMQVLKGHAKLIAKLSAGEIIYGSNVTVDRISVKGGIAEVSQDNITVLI